MTGCHGGWKFAASELERPGSNRGISRALDERLVGRRVIGFAEAAAPLTEHYRTGVAGAIDLAFARVRAERRWLVKRSRAGGDEFHSLYSWQAAQD